MDTNNPFDRHLEATQSMPTKVRDAAIFVNATAEVAWLSAQSVFGTAATPELALHIYDRIVERMQHHERPPHNHNSQNSKNTQDEPADRNTQT